MLRKENNWNDEEVDKLTIKFLNSIYSFPGIRNIIQILNIKLIKALIDYTDDVGKQMIKVLKQNINYIITKETDDHSAILENDSQNTYMVVAGQASQFQPLLKKIISSVKDSTYGFNLKRSNLLHIENVDAKKACAWGALNSKRAGYDFLNKDRLFGIYIIKSPDSSIRYKVVDLVDLNDGNEVIIKKYDNNESLDQHVRHDLYYSTKIVRKKDEMINLLDGYTAYIQSLNSTSSIKISYDNNRKVLLINGKEITLGSYGQVGNLDSIYYNVWPELLKP